MFARTVSACVCSARSCKLQACQSRGVYSSPPTLSHTLSHVKGTQLCVCAYRSTERSYVLSRHMLLPLVCHACRMCGHDQMCSMPWAYTFHALCSNETSLCVLMHLLMTHIKVQ